MRARVIVTYRRGVLDPAGQAVRASLRQLGFEEVEDVRLGKVIDLELGHVTRERASERLEEMGRKLLANPVVEDFSVELE